MRSRFDSPSSPKTATPGYGYAPGPLDSLERAAVKLGTSAGELRDVCELLGARCGDVAVADLGSGIMAIHAGAEWRFRFPILGVDPHDDARPAR